MVCDLVFQPLELAEFFDVLSQVSCFHQVDGLSFAVVVLLQKFFHGLYELFVSCGMKFL